MCPISCAAYIKSVVNFTPSPLNHFWRYSRECGRDTLIAAGHTLKSTKVPKKTYTFPEHFPVLTIKLTSLLFELQLFQIPAFFFDDPVFTNTQLLDSNVLLYRVFKEQGGKFYLVISWIKIRKKLL